MSDALGMLWDGLVWLLGGIVRVIATTVAFLIGAVLIMLVSAIWAAVGGAVLATIVFLITAAFGSEFILDRWVGIFQTCFWILFIVKTIVGFFQWRSRYQREQRLKMFRGW